jgi:hypothetical protein
MPYRGSRRVAVVVIALIAPIYVSADSEGPDGDMVHGLP